MESLLLRTGQVIGVIGVDDKSLQRRLFTFTGAKTLFSVHENPHRGFFGSLLEALVAMDANIDLIKCSKI